MRITEIISEAGIISQIKKDYQRGYDAVDRIVNPAKWGSQSDKPSKSNSSDSLDIRDAVQALADGRRIYEQQRQLLLKIIQKIKSGELETKQNAPQLMAILKSAAAGKPLDDQQRAVISAFSREI